MSELGVIFSGKLTDAMLFSVLLTVESLLFAGIGFVLTLSGPAGSIRKWTLSPSVLGKFVAALVSAVAFCACVTWVDLFADPWSWEWRRAAVAAVILATVLAEALIAWVIAVAMKPKAGVPAAT